MFKVIDYQGKKRLIIVNVHNISSKVFMSNLPVRHPKVTIPGYNVRWVVLDEEFKPIALGADLDDMPVEIASTVNDMFRLWKNEA